MQHITKQDQPALHLALSYLFIDNCPFGHPEEFRLAAAWDVPLLEATCAALSFAPLPAGQMAHHPGDDVLDSELWCVVAGDEDMIARVQAKYPNHLAGLELLNECLNSCFEGDDSETWVETVR